MQIRYAELSREDEQFIQRNLRFFVGPEADEAQQIRVMRDRPDLRDTLLWRASKQG